MADISQFVANNNGIINVLPRLFRYQSIKFGGLNKSPYLIMYVPVSKFTKNTPPTEEEIKNFILMELDKEMPSPEPLIVLINGATDLTIQMRPSCVIMQNGKINQPFSCYFFMRTPTYQGEGINYKSLFKNHLITEHDKKLTILNSDELLTSINIDDLLLHFVYILKDDLDENIKYYLERDILCVISRKLIMVNKNHARHDALMSIMPEHEEKYTRMAASKLKLKTQKHYDFFLEINFS